MNYVNNEELYNEICLWKQSMRDAGHHVKMPDSIGIAIITIAQRFTGYFKFSGYSRTWKDAMIADAVEAVIKGLHNFDEFKYKNPHAYITRACFNAFIQRIKYEKREMATKYKYFLTHVYDDQDADMVKLADECFLQDIHDKLNNYEASIKPSKQKEVPMLPTLEQFYEQEAET